MDFTILSGTANPRLACAIASEVGVKLGKCRISRFPDGEVSIDLCTPVRCGHVFLIQATAPPVDEHLIELLALADACRRAGAARITAVIPYFGYSRSDKRHGRSEPITASLVASLIEAAGIQHVITLDLHALQIEGFFRIPVDCLSGVPILCEAIASRLPEGIAVVSPDAGRVKMAAEYAQRLGAPVIILHKRRESGTETSIAHVVGDVRGWPCLIIDDMISTGGTIADSLEALLNAGARPEITVAATHGLFLDGAAKRLSHPAIRQVYVTDSIENRRRSAAWAGPNLEVVSTASLFADSICRLLGGTAHLRQTSAPKAVSGF